MKPNQKPTTVLNQDTIQNPTLKSLCLPLCKIRGIAELFSTILPDEMRELSSDACAGIFMTLQAAADEIQEVFDNIAADLEAEKKAKAAARERQARKLYDLRCGEVTR